MDVAAAASEAGRLRYPQFGVEQNLNTLDLEKINMDNL
jgi:hypothetical protein